MLDVFISMHLDRDISVGFAHTEGAFLSFLKTLICVESVHVLPFVIHMNST